jgi:TolB-like protein
VLATRPSRRSLTGAVISLAALAAGCGVASDGADVRASFDAGPSSALVGDYCGSYSGDDGFCDCTETCQVGSTSTCQLIGGGAVRADGQWCAAGVFVPTTEGHGACLRGRCCNPMVQLACDDGKACTLDLCVPGTQTCDNVVDCPASPNECWPGGCAGDGSCTTAYKGDGEPCSVGVCAGGASGSCQAGCWIDGAFRAADSPDPANPCQRCDVATSRTAWTPFADATPCGTGQLCAGGVCRPGCFIDGSWRPSGGAKPGEECWICDPATPLAWTASFGACRGDGLECTDDRCGGDGACHHDPIPGCAEPTEESLYGCGSAGGSGGLLLAAAALLLAGRRRLPPLALLLALLAAPLHAAAAPARPSPAKGAKLAVLNFRAGPGVAPQTAEVVTRALSAAIQERTGYGLLTTADLLAVLDFEQQKTAMGCTGDQCLAEMGGALGVDWLVTGAVGRIGASLALNAQVLDVRTGVALRRFATTSRETREEAFLDLVGPAAEALFPDALPPARFALSVRAEAELRSPLGGGGAILFEARVGEAFRAGGGCVATASHFGGVGRLAWLPAWRDASLHPVLAAELTIMGGGGTSVGLGLNPGIEWAPHRALAVLLEVPLQWFPAAPEHTRTAYALAALSAAWRF